MKLLARAALTWALLASGVSAADVLETVGFSSCNSNASVSVERVDIKYNNDNKTVSFDVAGTSNKEQKVTAVLKVTAYGQDIYSRSFDPCEKSTFVEQLCPVPAGNFAARGTQQIPAEFADMVPSIAFQIPDIAAMATLELHSKDSGERVACIQSQVTNGKTASVPAVSYVAVGVAGAALVLGGISAAGAVFAGGGAAAGGGSAAGGTSTPSPTFTEVFSWFQGMAMNGMLSVNYPNVYRSFTKNFGFSVGLVPWTDLQVSIDNFRAATGGNLTENSVEFLRNATLVYPDGSAQTTQQGLLRRAVDQFVLLAARQIETSINGTLDEADPHETAAQHTVRVAVSGIQGYVQQLSIPSGNMFMTILLIVAIIIAAIVVGILLVKVVLEFWALFGSFPKSLAGFRKHYWGSIARAVTSLILLLYGVWVLYCVFQFTRGDSWAAKVLAGVTLFLFTAVLAYFSWKIWSTARRLKKVEGDVSSLYDDKNIWVKYSLFYESYRRDYWWLFVPTIIYMFAKGVIIAGADGHGMVQTSGQLIIEAIMLILLLWSRPYERRSSNIINIAIQVVRVLSVVCILVFVEQFGIAQTTKTVTGVVLIAVQSALTGILAILIACNAFIACFKMNPHRKRRKELEKLQQRDTLTPLDARNSLLFKGSKTADSDDSSSISLPNKSGFTPLVSVRTDNTAADVPEKYSNGTNNKRNSRFQDVNPSRENLVAGAAPLGGNAAALDPRQPTLPDLGGGYGGPGSGGQGQAGGYDGYGNYRGPYRRW
ncbi:hypothetical protein VTG60DRAFT_3139 [Thermothelomyces hinnuleus]